MKYKGNANYKHDTPTGIGVLVTNLGTPEAPTPRAIKKYLAEFLADPRVIELPKIIWQFLLHGIILQIRPYRLAKTYSKIWDRKGSPLLTISIEQVNKIQIEINKRVKRPIRVKLAMRYGNPSIEASLEELRAANTTNLLVLPLYPQYSAATTASTFDAVTATLKKWRLLPELRIVNHYHDNLDYIYALADSIKRHWQQHLQPEKLIFSFHGLPKDYFLKGDPYHCECHKTARLVAETLALKDNEWLVTFQSRFGPKEWLQPYTDMTLTKLAESGTKHVQIICPGFAADCLETLEEINIQNKEFFTAAGGELFSYIPALNDTDSHINVLCSLIEQYIQGWDKSDETATDLAERANRAKVMGAVQ